MLDQASTNLESAEVASSLEREIREFECKHPALRETLAAFRLMDQEYQRTIAQYAAGTVLFSNSTSGPVRLNG